jgi:hypothetical protein
VIVRGDVRYRTILLPLSQWILKAQEPSRFAARSCRSTVTCRAPGTRQGGAGHAEVVEARRSAKFITPIPTPRSGRRRHRRGSCSTRARAFRDTGGDDRHDSITRKLFMNKFRKLGFIEYNGKLEVHNSLLNVVLHEKPEIKTRDETIGAE